MPNVGLMQNYGADPFAAVAQCKQWTDGMFNAVYRGLLL